MKNKINVVRHILFWSWNLLFIALVNLGVMPLLGPDILDGLKRGVVNADFAAFFAVVLVMPTIATLLGVVFLRKDSKKLLDLMYCIELPLLALVVFRIFFLRDLTVGVGFFLSLFAASSLYFAYRLFLMKSPNSFGNLVGATIFLWCGVWIFLMLSFLIPPAASGVFEVASSILMGLSKMDLSDVFQSLFGIFYVLIGSVFVVYTLTLLLVFPIYYIYSSFRNWLRPAFFLFAIDRTRTLACVAATLATVTIVFFVATDQKHEAALLRLQTLSGTEAERMEIGTNESFYRKVLRDIYLAPYRYLGDSVKSNFIQDLYKRTFDIEPDSTRWIQTFFNNVARPFIYRGSSGGMSADQRLAEKFYSEVLDASIQEDERESIRYAIQSTYSVRGVEASLVSIDDIIVHLEKQELSIKEEGEWAEVELHEIYDSSSYRPQEISLHFRMPSGAVITGLWLSDDDTKKYVANVSPRGAAQKVYREIVRRGADPALVEQVGPQLYRLRVFPIPPNGGRSENKRVMHMWLRFRLLKQNEGAWELPTLTEKRNLYWDRKTHYIVNGSREIKGDNWLPSEISSRYASSPIHQVFQLGGQTVELLPYDRKSMSTDCSMAVVVDTSFSMRNRLAELLRIHDSIEASCGRRGVEYFLWKNGPAKVTGDFRKALEDHVFWGVFGPQDLAERFITKENQKRAVVVLTDRTFFRESEEEVSYQSFDRPIWFLLLDRQYGRSVSDDLLKRFYEVGGGIDTEWERVWAGYARYEHKANNKDVLDIDGRYIWKLSQAKDSKDIPEGAEPLVAHKLILNAVESGMANGNKELDRLQKMAVRANIVSPFSSMLVLVDEAQRKMLEEAEKEKDRFDRQVETGEDILTSPKSPFQVTAVPEPEEWALIIAVFGLLFGHLYRQRFHGRRGSEVA